MPNPEELREPTGHPMPDRSGDRALIVLLIASLFAILLPTWFADRSDTPLRVTHLALETPGIDLRTAPWYEWTLLDGIGEARARRIVSYRAALGRPIRFEDLHDIPGMPAGWVDDAKRYLHASQAAGGCDGE